MEAMRPAAWRLFVELADAGSITRVAQARNAAQPHISRQLGELEALCGGRLFARHGRGVALTDLGIWVLPRVRNWLAETDQLESDIRTGSGVPIGEVRAALIPSVLHPLVTSVAAQLRERYPLVRLSVREGQGGQLDEWLDGGKVDLAVGYRYERELRDIDEVLVRADTYLVGPIGDTVTRAASVRFAALRGLPLILPCRPSAWRDTLDDIGRKQGFALQVATEADSVFLQRELVMGGGGHTILGPFAIAEALAARRLQAARIVEPVLPRVVTLSSHKRVATSLAHRVVAELMREAAKQMSGMAGVPVPAGKKHAPARRATAH
ncbi:MAG: transcriptional regulator [Betaproteobacteria bacterium]|nr:transcriptional regulator [Betaproteobacteria bacterium]